MRLSKGQKGISPRFDDAGMPPGLYGRPVLGCSLPGPRPVAHRRAQGGMVKCLAGRSPISGAAKRSRLPVPDLTRSAGININERLLLRGRKDRLG
jgi:hypothetical protein